MLQAAAQGDLRSLEDKLLVEYEVDAVQPGSDGVGALHLAAQSGRLDVVAYLLERGCNVNLRTKKLQQTALHMCASPTVAVALLDGGADPTILDLNVHTAVQGFQDKKQAGDSAAAEVLAAIEAWLAATKSVDRAVNAQHRLTRDSGRGSTLRANGSPLSTIARSSSPLRTSGSTLPAIAASRGLARQSSSSLLTDDPSRKSGTGRQFQPELPGVPRTNPNGAIGASSPRGKRASFAPTVHHLRAAAAVSSIYVTTNVPRRPTVFGLCMTKTECVLLNVSSTLYFRKSVWWTVRALICPACSLCFSSAAFLTPA